MNTYTKVGIALLSGLVVWLEMAYPHATWSAPIITAITVAFGTMHVAMPKVPAAPPNSSTSTPVDARAPEPSRTANVP